MKRRHAIKTFISASILPFMPFKSLFAKEDCLTTTDILGPYFIEGAPTIMNIAPEIENIPRLFITGTVYANDCITPIPNALIDIWQANNEGAYEDIDYRGKIYTDQAGNYAFETIQAGKYLNGSYYRPSHIHYKVVYQNNPEFITQLYFEGDTSIENDPWASDPSASERIITLTADNNNNLNGVFDIYLNIDPTTVQIVDFNRNDISSKLISISPNPISEVFEVQFFCSKKAKVTIDICDISARNIHTLMNKTCQRGKSNITFKKPRLEPGVYVIRLSIDDLKIDAKRVFIR
ncbi:MAG: T9SS type A sorting domain-containing protein [Flavobacteriales bacterium]